MGFQQNDNPDLPTLDADLIVSESGLTFQQEHPLVDLEVLHSVAQQFAAYQFDQYNAATAYTQGQRVRFNDENYQWNNATPSTPGTAPPAASWIVVDLFNPFLRNMRKQSIAKVLNA